MYHNGPTDEMRFMLGNHLMRFSKFGVIPDATLYASLENDIHQRYFASIDEVLFEEMRVVLSLSIPFIHSSMRLTGDVSGSRDANKKRALTYTYWRPIALTVYHTPY
ncbi:hypothetical protein Ddye_020505 [Dipteronia dyeriana]|uniref:Uncharacterized protein n=1 Tax=Dipteronia dyeriana TaxID=168575 RepID=A0AAD9U0X0_9ROSI|nr:hypothetical protein Ddye_020505 [Dipteronia dyeriana]